MEYRTLASTGLRVSELAVGAGPISGLFVGDNRDALRRTVERALEHGVNWFDTAATYGDGQSEHNLGRTLTELHAERRVHVATKVRVMPERLAEPAAAVRDSFAASLARLGLQRVTLLQVHNSITARAGSQPTSITPAHMLAPGGILDAMQGLRSAGLVDHFGLTGMGDRSALVEVIDTGQFATIQVPYNVLDAQAFKSSPAAHARGACVEDDAVLDDGPLDYARLVDACGGRGVAVLAIRVLAGGALAGHPPSEHTLKTPFFPLEVYQRHVAKAERLAALLPAGMRREEAALRFVLSHPAVASAIVGFQGPEQVDEMARFAAGGALDAATLARLNEGPS